MSINKNDIANGKGICVSLFVSGCPHKCSGCFNPEAWKYEAGQLFTQDTMAELIEALRANGVPRNFSVLGGEPLAPQNRETVDYIIQSVKHCCDLYPKIYLWTGYIYEDLLAENDPVLNSILSNVDVLIDGPYIQELRDLTLPLRGSSNQRILELKIDKK